MDKTAIKNASRLLDEVPANNEDALEEYIQNNKKAQSDLRAYLNSPFQKQAFDYVEADGMIEQLKARLPYVQNNLDAVRSERAQDLDSGYEEQFDLPTTVNRLAAQKALETQGMPSLDQFYSAKKAFQENIEPILVEGYEDFPREQFIEAFNRYASLEPAELRRVLAEEFPKNDWIGEEPMPAEDLNPTSQGEDGAPDPEPDYIDQEFGDGTYKSVLKNRQSSKEAGSVPSELRPFVGDNEDKSTKDDDDDKDDDDKDKDKSDKSDKDDSDKDKSDKDDKDDKDDDKEKESAKNWERIYQTARNSRTAEEFKQAVEAPGKQDADIVGQGDKVPEADGPWENWFDSESNKGQKAPTGPDRANKSSRKLAAAMRIAEVYDIDADGALDLVEKVLEDE